MSNRETALNGSIALGGSDDQILRRAEKFYRWLNGQKPLRLVLDVGPAHHQGTAPFPGPMKETHMAQLHDDQEFEVTVSARDAKGFEVADQFTASVDDTSVATVEALEDGKTFVVTAGNPGSAVMTVTDGTLSATLAIDVVPGDVALIQLQVGDPSDQAPAEPTA